MYYLSTVIDKLVSADGDVRRADRHHAVQRAARAKGARPASPAPPPRARGTEPRRGHRWLSLSKPLRRGPGRSAAQPGASPNSAIAASRTLVAMSSTLHSTVMVMSCSGQRLANTSTPGSPPPWP